MPAPHRRMSYAAALASKTRASARRAKKNAITNENSPLGSGQSTTTPSVQENPLSPLSPPGGDGIIPPRTTPDGGVAPHSATRISLAEVPLNVSSQPREQAIDNMAHAQTIVNDSILENEDLITLSPLPPSSPIQSIDDQQGTLAGAFEEGIAPVSDLTLIACNHEERTIGSPTDSDRMWAAVGTMGVPQPAMALNSHHETTVPTDAQVGGTAPAAWGQSLSPSNHVAGQPTPFVQHLTAPPNEATEKRPWEGSPTSEERTRSNRPRLEGDPFSDAPLFGLRQGSTNPWLTTVAALVTPTNQEQDTDERPHTPSPPGRAHSIANISLASYARNNPVLTPSEHNLSASAPTPHLVSPPALFAFRTGLLPQPAEPRPSIPSSQAVPMDVDTAEPTAPTMRSKGKERQQHSAPTPGSGCACSICTRGSSAAQTTQPHAYATSPAAQQPNLLEMRIPTSAAVPWRSGQSTAAPSGPPIAGPPSQDPTFGWNWTAQNTTVPATLPLPQYLQANATYQPLSFPAHTAPIPAPHPPLRYAAMPIVLPPPQQTGPPTGAMPLAVTRTIGGDERPTPEPQGGWPVVHRDDPEAFLRGLSPEWIATLWEVRTGAVVLIEPFNQKFSTSTEHNRLIAIALKDAISKITGQLSFKIIPPEIFPGLNPSNKNSPTLWAARGLSQTAADTLIRGRVWSLSSITFLAYSRDLPIPTWLLALEGFVDDDEEGIKTTVETVLRRTEPYNAMIALAAGSPEHYGKNPQVVTEECLRSLRIKVDTYENGGIVANVYMNSPTQDTARWRGWVASLRSMSFGIYLTATARPKPISWCQGCRSVDHPAHLCPLPRVPGWNGPAAGTGHFAGLSAPGIQNGVGDTLQTLDASVTGNSSPKKNGRPPNGRGGQPRGGPYRGGRGTRGRGRGREQ